MLTITDFLLRFSLLYGLFHLGFVVVVCFARKLLGELFCLQINHEALIPEHKKTVRLNVIGDSNFASDED